jgi:DNA-binding NarL/FixJ family response regulator
MAVAEMHRQSPLTRTVTRVMVVDDHTTFAQSLGMALDAKPEFECVGTAATGAAALDLAMRTNPDVVVMDLQLGAESGLAVTRRIRDAVPDAVIVVLTAHLDPSWVAKASQAGASAFAAKSGLLRETLTMLKDAKHGGMLVAPSLYDVGPSAPKQASPVSKLTARETNVLALMGKGANVEEIARVLNISVNTCRGYVKGIHVKLDARSQLEAVIKAQQLGLIAISVNDR